MAPKAITRLKVAQQPYAIVGGIGSSYGVKKVLEAPGTFPLAFLEDTIQNVKSYSEKYGAHLEKYIAIVGEFLRTDRKGWQPYHVAIAQPEAGLFDQE